MKNPYICSDIILLYEKQKEEIEEILRYVLINVRYERAIGTDIQYLYIETIKNTWRLFINGTDYSFMIGKQNAPCSLNYFSVKDLPQIYNLCEAAAYIDKLELLDSKEGHFVPYYSKIKEKAAAKGISVDLVRSGKDQILYMKTNLAFWRVQYSERTNLYYLEHAPFTNSENRILASGVENAPKAKYHRQKDAYQRNNVEAYIEYIYEHDTAKALIRDVGYKALPKSTPKQKHYYAQAKQRKKQQEINRTIALLEKLERKDLRKPNPEHS